MRMIALSCIFVFLGTDLAAQSPEPPISDTRLTIHTLVREDIFAGWRAKNMERLARGEKNIELLLEERPEARADLLAWKGGAALYRAVLAHEADDPDEFASQFQKTRELFAEARKLGPKSVGVAAVCGGSYVMFADRLPNEHRAEAWSDAYNDYMVLWKQQSPALPHLPPHIRGELLGGLAQSAQRTGRKAELDHYLDKILEVLPDTPYGRVAKEWKSDPKAAAIGSIGCKTCHAEGRLASVMAANKGK